MRFLKENHHNLGKKCCFLKLKLKPWSMVKTTQKSKIENFEQVACFLDTRLAHKKTAFGVGP